MSVSDRSTWTVGILADFLEERQRTNEELIRSRYEADQAALSAALVANEKRLDAMNEFRGAMQDQAARSITRAEFETAMSAARERGDEALAPLMRAVSEQGKPNWMMLIGLGSVAISVLAGCWLIIGLQINYAITPQVLSIEQLRTYNQGASAAGGLIEGRIRTLETGISGSAAADAESRIDRARLNNRLEKQEQVLSNGVAERKAADARFSAALVEVETQFCATDTVRNLMHAADLRLMSILWSATHKGEHFPTDNAVYPVVCNRGSITANGSVPP